MIKIHALEYTRLAFNIISLWSIILIDWLIEVKRIQSHSDFSWQSGMYGGWSRSARREPLTFKGKPTTLVNYKWSKLYSPCLGFELTTLVFTGYWSNSSATYATRSPSTHSQLHDGCLFECAVADLQGLWVLDTYSELKYTFSQNIVNQLSQLQLCH